jgi:ubiquitin conjugation factor E4 B
VDPEYYKHTRRLYIDEETKIRATKEEADAYFATDNSQMEIDPKPPSFISELFFLLNSFQHLGVIKTISTRGKAEKNISEMEKELRRAEASRGDWDGVSRWKDTLTQNTALEAQCKATIAQLKADIATLHASIHAYDTQLLDPALTRLNVTFSGFLMTWLVRLVDPKHLHPATLITYVRLVRLLTSACRCQ